MSPWVDIQRPESGEYSLWFATEEEALRKQDHLRNVRGYYAELNFIRPPPKPGKPPQVPGVPETPRASRFARDPTETPWRRYQLHEDNDCPGRRS